MKKKDIIFGKNAVIEAIKSGATIDTVWISQQTKDTGEIQRLCKECDIPTKKVPSQKIDYLIYPFYKDQNVSHQGVVAIINEFEYSRIDDIYNFLIEQGRQPVFVLLDRITDVGNFGAIARSAVCFDMDAIIIPNRNSVSVNAQAVKASAGALSQIPICRVDNVWEALDYLVQCGFQVIGSSEKAQAGLEQIDVNLPTVLVLGNENTGISLPMQKVLTQSVKINMNSERFDSLNVSVSAGILFHHFFQKRVI
jgi:23S rRNA (guanosine2251-2'-O)-methyltransferase